VTTAPMKLFSKISATKVTTSDTSTAAVASENCGELSLTSVTRTSS